VVTPVRNLRISQYHNVEGTLSTPIVLIAEDDADTRDVIRRLLESSGFIVVGAEDSMLALSALGSVRPDVILVDIMMPGVDGVGLIRWIRANPESETIPIIAMTAYEEFHLRRAEKAGANLSIRKPEQIPDLPQIVHRLFSS